jgi:hypothetical protein
MAMGREGDRRGDLIVTWAEMARSPGHVFYDRLQEVLIAAGFDGFVETACQPITRRRWEHRRIPSAAGQSGPEAISPATRPR